MEEQTDMDIDELTQEQIEQLKGALAHAMLTPIPNKEQQMREMKDEMTVLANTFADCADVFLTRFRGRLPLRKIVSLINIFFQTLHQGSDD
jgi:hypothetical protein